MLSWWIDTAISIARNRTLWSVFVQCISWYQIFLRTHQHQPATAAEFSSVIIKNTLDWFARAFMRWKFALHTFHLFSFLFLFPLHCCFELRVCNHSPCCTRTQSSHNRRLPFSMYRTTHRVASTLYAQTEFLRSNSTMYFIYLYLFYCATGVCECACIAHAQFNEGATLSSTRVCALALFSATISTLEFTMRRKKFHS